MTSIEFLGRDALVSNDRTAFTYSVSENPRDFETYRNDDVSVDWKDKDYHIGAWRIHPYGDNNNLPKEIQQTVQSNPDAPGALKKKVQMLWGKGPKLYLERYDDDGMLIRTWQESREITKWLESWDYEEYLRRAAVDTTTIEGNFTKFFLNKGARVAGKKKQIAKLEHSSIDRTRLASVYKKKLIKPTHAVVTDFRFEGISSLIDMDVYPLFDFLKPFQNKVSILYCNMYSFCMDYYTVPDIYGALEWLRRSNAIPIILKALSKNSINLKYHIVSPQEFWNQEEARIKERCTVKKIEYKESMLKEYEENLLKQVAKVLSGESNVGKFWHTKKILEVDGSNLLEHGWEIKVIDQNTKDYIAGQISISNHSSQKVNSSIGVHSALSNTGEKGKVDSGGEQHYAFKNYLEIGIDIPEAIACKAINYAIKVNFPKSDLKLGFYHTVPKKLEETTPKER